MSRRILALVLLGVAAAYAAVLPPPQSEPQPRFTEAIVEGPASTAASSVWYCPWANSGAFRDSTYLMASASATDTLISLPSALPTDPGDEVGGSIAIGPGAAALAVGEVVRNGDAPGFVEMSDGPAAAAVVVRGERVLTGDRCVRNLTKQWYLTGGTTREGRTTILRLFNPLATNAKVEVIGASEFGLEPIADLNSVDVPPRSWVDVDLNERVPFLDTLSLTVTVVEGDVVPTMVVRADNGDEASWPGTSLATTWYFPTVTQGGLVPSLVVTNPSAIDVEVSINVFGPTVTRIAAATVVVAAGQPRRIALNEIATGAFGIGINATGPVAAVVVAEDGGSTSEAEGQIAAPDGERIAATVGTEILARTWLLPGPNHLGEAISSLWIMNPTADVVTVTLQPLGDRSLAADKITIDPGRLRRIVLDPDSRVVGYQIEATQPVAASWSIHFVDRVAFIAGTPIERSDG